MTKYHDIYSLSVQKCQQMLMSNDIMLICDGKQPFIKARAKKAHAKFIEQLQGLFGGEDELIEAIGKDTFIMSMGAKKTALSNLKDGLLCCYQVKDNVKGKIKALDDLKATYRKIYFDYPKNVDANADYETQQKQIDAVIKPIESEIQRLTYKIKELSPPIKDVVKKDKDEKAHGLELHIMFLQSVSPEHFYIQMSISDFSTAYNAAVKKHSKLKVKA